MSSPELRSSLMVRFNRYRKSGAARRVGWEGGTPTQVSTSSETVFEFRPEIATCRDRKRMRKDTYQTRKKFANLHLSDAERLIVAERVGFAPLPVVENKELNGFSLSHDPLNPHESPGRSTY